MSNDSLVQLLILLAGVIGIIVFVLIFVWFIIRSKEKRAEREKQYEKYEKTHVKKSQVIYTPERQSLNRSILSKKYYIVIPCYQSEISTGDFDKSEVKNMAFSELYTRARAVINSLFACQVTGKVLNSEELTELLYVAYNRDESDLFWMDKIKQAGFEELYSSAPDVLDKKRLLID